MAKTKMAATNYHIAIITLNVNGINLPQIKDTGYLVGSGNRIQPLLSPGDTSKL